jgi:hypothetical protein
VDPKEQIIRLCLLEAELVVKIIPM